MWNVLLHGNHSVYNVGSPSTFSIGEVATAIAAITHANIDFPEDLSELPGAHGGVVMDIARAENEFNKRSYVGLIEGLKRTIEWHRGLNESV